VILEKVCAANQQQLRLQRDQLRGAEHD
jgi:hypothetical protein